MRGNRHAGSHMELINLESQSGNFALLLLALSITHSSFTEIASLSELNCDAERTGVVAKPELLID